jgi:hypothetical protein
VPNRRMTDHLLRPLIIDNSRTEHVTRTIIEKRAPTDESVRLLAEMEQAAEAKLISSVNVSNTAFECVVHSIKDYLSDGTMLRAVFRLNGEQCTAEYRHNNSDINSGIEEAATGLRDAVAKVIANKMIATAFSKINRN